MRRPREARKATPTPIAMAAFAPVDKASVLDGAVEGLGAEVWLSAAAAVGVVIVVVDDDGVKVVDIAVVVVVV